MIVLPILYLKAVWKTLSDGLKYSISTKGQSMTPQEQKNRLNDIMFHAQRCELYDDEHRLYRIGKNSEATLNVNNVFNTRYRTLSTFLAYGEARSAVLGFKYRF